jgi:hypothetical protein
LLVVGATACLLASCWSGSSRSSRSSSSTSPRNTAASSTTAAPGSGAQWTTYDRDPARSGVAPDGPASASGIRRLWSSPTLDGEVYAQPLLVGDRVISATENDSVYALDSSNGSVVWKAHLGAPVPGSSLPCGNVDPVGITSTPVVDLGGGRIYVVGLVQPGMHMLFGLELSSGRVVASARVDATGADPLVHNQRSALTFSNGSVFVPYGGRFGDCGDYHGRIVSVPVAASGLGTPSSYALPTQREGGLWAPPGAALGSDGSLYLASGNSSSRGTYDYGNSVIRLSPNLKLIDSFAPSNWASLNSSDTDLGSTSPVLLPGNRVFQIGKGGIGYLLDARHLGGMGGELGSARVCDARSFGGIAHDGDTMFVPCGDAVVQVTVSGESFTTGWSASVSTPGPTIVAGSAVWVVATGSGNLLGLDPSSGRTISSQHIGRVPSQFTSPAAGGGRVVVAADRTVFAFGT